MTKKKVLFHSDFSLAKTGFGKVMRFILTYLYKTGKYDLYHYCCAVNWSSPEHNILPWKSIGCLPDSQFELNNFLMQFPAQERETRARLVGYGAYNLDKIIKEVNPDVYIASQDIWGIDYAIEKPWFNKIPSVIWTTLDSLPLLPTAVEKAPKIKNYWIWSNFATKEMHRLGHTHVRTVHGPLETSFFYRLGHEHGSELRKKFSIPSDAFVIGFVFRNQLRKSVPNLLEGYALWKKNNPNVKSYLLFHTNFSEGWNIHRLAKEYNIDTNEILTTYICRNCKEYEIKPFTSQEIKCPYCNNDKGQITTNVGFGVTESQLNEVYNLMDVYAHCHTSGGMEVPIFEAKLTELVTLVTNYSCGEEACEDGAGSLPLEWFEYREHGTEFRKASTDPKSICKQLDVVYKMSPKERLELGKIGRDWVIKNYSIEVIGKIFEEFLDNCPAVESWSWEKPAKNPMAVIPPTNDDDEWIISLYRKILKMDDIDENDSGFQYWKREIQNGRPKAQIEEYFRQVAIKENQKSQAVKFEDLLNKNNKKRFILVCPESGGDVLYASSLLKSLRDHYPSNEWDIYFATKPEYFELLDCNPYIDKLLPYLPFMENEIHCIGQAHQKGLFDGYCFLTVGSQRILNYLSNHNTCICT